MACYRDIRIVFDATSASAHMEHDRALQDAAQDLVRPILETPLQVDRDSLMLGYSVAELAARLNTSERKLNRAFEKTANQTPSAICRDMRLAHGHWLLINTTRTITQISQECGFADGAHFSRWFKRKYLESPAQFRTRRRGLQIPATHGTRKRTAKEPAWM